MKKIILIIYIFCIAFGVVNAQNLEELKQLYSIDNPNESSAVKIIYDDSIKPKNFNEVSVLRALSLFKVQKDKIEIDAKLLTVLYNETKIQLFMPVDEVINLCPELGLKTDTTGLYYVSKNNVVSLRTIEFKNKKYINEITIDDYYLQDRKLKNYGIIVVNGFPVTRNQNPNATHEAFNKLAIDDSGKFSGYGMNWKYYSVIKSKDEDKLAMLSSLYVDDYFRRLQNKKIVSQLKWQNSPDNKFTIYCSLTGIDPEDVPLEAPGSNYK
ncbi:hypothetical protein EZJ43_13330 [Pedobacter changchengzhani]|uniref:Uncharacterized protein n=1 Tax=Pedobacter changchengzhani TaxID=2529274 RepID=A0A4R5MIY3_9SPHI|nr:hypothetical protein [Pedobacter changchengzhani]TDG35597.1 hypothetical protein EZJ43_13330 [Pedobacter changchengzhani]